MDLALVRMCSRRSRYDNSVANTWYPSEVRDEGDRVSVTFSNGSTMHIDTSQYPEVARYIAAYPDDFCLKYVCNYGSIGNGMFYYDEDKWNKAMGDG